MQSGENWNYVQTNCMIQEKCIEVTEDIWINNGTQFIWARTPLDSIADQATLAQIPPQKLVSLTREMWCRRDQTFPFCCRTTDALLRRRWQQFTFAVTCECVQSFLAVWIKTSLACAGLLCVTLWSSW